MNEAKTMSNEIMTFTNEQFGNIRSILIDGSPYFSGTDVARALGYNEPHKAVARHCRDDGMKRTPIKDSLDRVQETVFISEGNLYRLIASSKLSSAEKFEKWVFDEVLPAIRKNGAYVDTDAIKRKMLTPDFIIGLATELKNAQEKNEELAAANDEMKPKAEYFDKLVDSHMLTNFRESAKLLGYSQTEFTSWLLSKNYVYRDKRGMLRPYELHRKNGLFCVKTFQNANGWFGTRTFVTVKGLETFRLLMQVPDRVADDDADVTEADFPEDSTIGVMTSNFC